MLCGDPSKAWTGVKFHPDTTIDGFFMTPDNIAFDPKGRMFVATDGMNDFDLADGIFAVDTDGPARALPKALFCCPIAPLAQRRPGLPSRPMVPRCSSRFSIQPKNRKRSNG
jgi:secreted PhoX family phosphatase